MVQLRLATYTQRCKTKKDELIARPECTQSECIVSDVAKVSKGFQKSLSEKVQVFI